MRFKLLILILLIYQISSSQSTDTGSVTYVAELDMSGFGEMIIKHPEFSKQIERELSNNKDVDYILKFSANESNYSKLKKIENEGTQKKINITEIKAGKGLYYTNIKENTILHQKDAFGEKFIISYPGIKWELVNETKKIGEYLCYKAIGSKNIEGKSGIKNIEIIAWYTTDIAKNFGPKEFSGLPGLILSLQEGQITYNATKIELNLDKKKINVKTPKKGKKMTLKEFNKMVKKLVTNNK